MHGRRVQGTHLASGLIVTGLLLSALITPAPARAQSSPSEITDARPYDDKLIRLSEILGAVHYLRELCGGNEGQVWRDRMRELIDTDKGSPCAA